MTRRSQREQDAEGALLFHHVPKTGGTSLINRIRALAPAGSMRTGPANQISVKTAQALARERLPSAAFIHGHPDWGACRPLIGQVRVCTLLRDPARQIVSHYLHALRDPGLPQHAAAAALGFRDYLLTFRFNLAFQTLALYSGIADPVEERRRALARPSGGGAIWPERHFARMSEQVFAYLEGMAAVGVTEEIDAFFAATAAMQGWPVASTVQRDNAADDAQARMIPLLLEQLAEVTARPEVATLFAIEQATHARARSLAIHARERRETASADAVRLCHAIEGEVFAGMNLVADSSTGTVSAGAANGPPIWTGPRELSSLWVRLAIDDARLQLELGALAHVGAGEIHVAFGDEWLPLFCEAIASGVLVTIDLAPLNGRAGHLYELKLYLERNGYPTSAPFHPAVRIDRITLSSC